MNLTIEQALAVYPLSEGRLIVGASGKNRIVRWINVTDTPDITGLDQGRRDAVHDGLFDQE